jgi:hypothetical protein
MMRSLLCVVVGLALVTMGTGGCEQPKTDMAQMKAPPRPVELDRLNDLVGRWEGTAEMTAAGSDKTTSGKFIDTIAWEADNRLLLERMEGTMGEGDKMSGLGIWSWDSKTKKYRTWWFDSQGSVTTATGVYNEETKSWNMTSEGRCPVTGQKQVGEGTMKMTDKSTIQWSEVQYDGWKLKKQMEMKGTLRRK